MEESKDAAVVEENRRETKEKRIVVPLTKEQYDKAQIIAEHDGLKFATWVRWLIVKEIQQRTKDKQI